MRDTRAAQNQKQKDDARQKDAANKKRLRAEQASADQVATKLRVEEAKQMRDDTGDNSVTAKWYKVGLRDNADKWSTQLDSMPSVVDGSKFWTYVGRLDSNECALCGALLFPAEAKGLSEVSGCMFCNKGDFADNSSIAELGEDLMILGQDPGHVCGAHYGCWDPESSCCRRPRMLDYYKKKFATTADPGGLRHLFSLRELYERPTTHEHKRNIVNLNIAHSFAQINLKVDGDMVKRTRNPISDDEKRLEALSRGLNPELKHKDKHGVEQVDQWQPSWTMIGELHSAMVPLRPRHGEKHRFLQQYWLEPEEQVRLRKVYMKGLSKEQLEKWTGVIHALNPYAIAFRRIFDNIVDYDNQRTKLAIMANIGAKDRRYRAEGAVPEVGGTGEIALLLPDAATGPSDVVLRLKGDDSFAALPQDNRACDALCFPLLHPFGEDGYKKRTGRDDASATIQKFYRYRMAVRSAKRSYNLAHRCGRLFHQYATAIGAKHIQDKMAFNRRPAFQKNKMRCDLKQNLAEAKKAWEATPKGARLTAEAKKTGRMYNCVYLDAKFKGSPRQMAELYRDSMAIVRSQGAPSLFITMVSTAGRTNSREDCC